MEKTIEIPEGYEARIEGNKVILERKSEDERIRREIIDYFYGCIHRNKKTGFRVEQIKGWIAHLERQKEQEQPEVDLEKETDQWRHKHFKGKRDGDYSGEYLERESQLDLARHFYELGLNARKEE